MKRFFWSFYIIWKVIEHTTWKYYGQCANFHENANYDVPKYTKLKKTFQKAQILDFWNFLFDSSW